MPPRERDSDFRRLLGDRDREGDLRPPRLGDRDTLLLGEGELLRRFGETDKELLRRLGDLDFLGDFDTFFLGLTESEVDLDRWPALLGDLRDGECNFLLDLGDRERDLERDTRRLFRGVEDSLPFVGDLEWDLDCSFTNSVV